MRFQVVLTPTEAKKLIAKAILELDIVQNALRTGIVAIHPCSTNYFIIKELLGEVPQGTWIFGVIAPKGTCRNRELLEGIKKRTSEMSKEPIGHTWVLEKGQLGKERVLRDLLEEMGPEDVFIKGANALDPEGNAGVLVARMDCGTVGRVMCWGLGKGIHLVFPVGLEKLIPVSIKQAALEAGIMKMDYSIGAPVGLLPVTGTVVTEIDAVKMLIGAKATPIASGGLKGAGGATTMVINGDEDQIQRAVSLIKDVKGAKLPKIDLVKCFECEFSDPYSACNEKTWIWKKKKEAIHDDIPEW